MGGGGAVRFRPDMKSGGGGGLLPASGPIQKAGGGGAVHFKPDTKSKGGGGGGGMLSIVCVCVCVCGCEGVCGEVCRGMECRVCVDGSVGCVDGSVGCVWMGV